MIEALILPLPIVHSWPLGLQVFAMVMIVPAMVYTTGHSLLRPFPKLFTAMHWLFSAYMLWVLVSALTTLVTR
uniref:hypothetical protein n=1 Tax=Weissella soli TaxID=155866 RepID=UPI00359F1C8B